MKKTVLLILAVTFIFSAYAQIIIQRDPEIEQMVKEAIQKTGENIKIKQFTRYEL